MPDAIWERQESIRRSTSRTSCNSPGRPPSATATGEKRTSPSSSGPATTLPTAIFHIRYSQLGDRFGDYANAVGYVQDDNRRELDSALEQTIWVKNKWLERIQYDSNYNIYWGLNGTLRSWQVDEGLSFDFKNKHFVRGPTYRGIQAYEKSFRNRETELTLGYNTREWQSAEAVFGFGKKFDLDYRLYEGKLNLKATESLSLEYSFSRLVFEPDPEGESTWIHLIRATQYFNKDLFLKVFYQLNSSIEKKYIQILFVYRFLPPFGLVQVAFQRDRPDSASAGIRATPSSSRSLPCSSRGWAHPPSRTGVVEFGLMDHDPRRVYEERTARFRVELGRVRRKDLVLGSAKLLIALAGLVLLYRVAVSGAGIPAFAITLASLLRHRSGMAPSIKAKKRLLALIEIQSAELNASGRPLSGHGRRGRLRGPRSSLLLRP